MPTGRGTRKTVETAFELEALGAPIEVRRHPTARRLTLRVSKTKRAVIVTVPVECRMEEADRFLRSNLDWVRDRLTRVPEPVPFADGSRIPLRGRLHRVSFTGPDRARSVVEIDQALSGAPRLNVAGRLEHAPRRLKDWRSLRCRALPQSRRQGAQDRAARSHQPLGLVHRGRPAGVLLAAHPRAVQRAQLRRRARGCASARDESRPQVLEARGGLHAAPRGRQALATEPRCRVAPLRCGALGRELINGGQIQLRCCLATVGSFGGRADTT
jgi:hypothetical protein